MDQDMLGNNNIFPVSLRMMVVITILVSFSSHIIAQDQVVHIATKKQLFIDDQLVDFAVDVGDEPSDNQTLPLYFRLAYDF